MKKLAFGLLAAMACIPHRAPVAAWRQASPRDCGPPRPFTARSGVLKLEGLDPDLRVKLDRRARAKEVAVLHIEHRSCNVEVEVLACTRKTGYVTEPSPAGTLDVFPARSLTDADVAGAGTLADVAGKHARISIDHRTASAREVSWEEDIRAASFPSRWGAWIARDAPPLAREELRGADCPRATHWAAAILDGTFRVLADDDAIDVTSCRPGECTEPIAIEPRPVFAFATPPEPPAAPPPAPTEPAPTEYEAAVALANLGFLRAADAKMTAIAEDERDPARAYAAFWLTVRDRRARSEDD